MTRPARVAVAAIVAVSGFVATAGTATAVGRSAGSPVATTPTTAYTYTVNSATADSKDADLLDHACAGVCGLRGAIEQANFNCTEGPNPDPSIGTTIRFAIPGAGVHTITPTRSTASGDAHPALLPGIVCPVVLDATSQPGYAGRPLIELDGSASAAAGELAYGLKFTANTLGSVVQGLTVNRWHGPGIAVSGPGGSQASGFVLRGNFIGTDPTGTVARPNTGQGISVAGNVRITIGGTASGEGNLLSGNGSPGASNGRGIDFGPGDATGSLVQGNFIGTDVSGTKAIPNSAEGIMLNSNLGSLLGGTAPGARNLVSGNNGNGIAVFGSAVGSLTMQGNFIGTQADGVHALGNVGFGIALQNSGGKDTIGGTSPGQGNTIAFNGKAGVQVGTGAAHRISGNSFFANTGLGIDLTPCSNGACPGPTPNDSGDLDSGPNLFQNFPVVGSVTSTTTSSTVKGSLSSKAGTTYQVELFSAAACDPSGYGEGKKLLGATAVTTTSSGTAPFSVTVPRVAAGNVVTATATDPAGNTSEFSPCRGPLTVTPTAAAPGATVKLAGKGFGAGQTVTLLWNCPISSCSGSSVLGTVVTGSAGTFSGKAVKVPATSVPGKYWIGARATAVFATVPITVS